MKSSAQRDWNGNSVAIVIPCYRHAHFLPAAIESALAQTIKPTQVIVVDDGSDDDTSDVASAYGQVTVIRQENRGLAAARNAGLRAADSEKIIFLDADDVLLPPAIAAGLRCFRDNPDAAFVYGAFREISGKSRPRKFTAVTSHYDFVRCNWIGCPATVMYDRSKLFEQGGFDESLGMTEDWDSYLRLSRHYPFAAHNTLVAHYMKHGANMSNSIAELKHWIEVVRDKEWARGLDEQGRHAWHEGIELWRDVFDATPKPKPSLLLRAFRKAARIAGLTLSR